MAHSTHIKKLGVEGCISNSGAGKQRQVDPGPCWSAGLAKSESLKLSEICLKNLSKQQGGTTPEKGQPRLAARHTAHTHKHVQESAALKYI